jgi:hypothetical protein
MRTSRFAAALTAAVALSAAVAAGAAAATLSPSYQVTGAEFGAPQGSTSTFTGFAVGSLGDRGLWRATVAHDPMTACSTVGSSCNITGGTLGLNSSNRLQLTGTVDWGTMTLTAQGAGCGRQQYTVTADAATTNGDMQLNAVVTTLRVSFRGSCLVLATTVQGTLATVATMPGG